MRCSGWPPDGRLVPALSAFLKGSFWLLSIVKERRSGGKGHCWLGCLWFLYCSMSQEAGREGID